MIPARNLFSLALLTVLWGVNWPVMKISLREMTPLYFRALTMTGGLLLLIAWYRSRGAKLRVPASALPQIALLAVPNVLAWHTLSIFGVQALASGRAAIVGFTMPIWTVVFGVLFFREQMSPRLWVATACAVVGERAKERVGVGVLGRDGEVRHQQLAHRQLERALGCDLACRVQCRVHG